MERVHLAAALLVIAILMVGVISVIALNLGQHGGSDSSGLPTLYAYNKVQTYPHDNNAFTQGLVFDEGVLYESTGGFGTSSLRRIDLESGKVLHEIRLQNDLFGEGLTLVNGSLVQLTWLNGVGFVYDKETFGLVGSFNYSTQGWGLTYDGSKLIMSDGTSNLYFLDPTTFEKTRQVSIRNGNNSVTNINELEYVNGDVYANIWLEQKIAIINPQTGQVKGWIDLTGIYQTNSPDDVLNGIAYDARTDRLFITGKNWPNLYQITITPAN